MAAAMGIPVPWVHTVVFAIGAAMAAASGVLFAPRGTTTDGFDFTLRAFVVVVVGGMGIWAAPSRLIFIACWNRWPPSWSAPPRP